VEVRQSPVLLQNEVSDSSCSGGKIHSVHIRGPCHCVIRRKEWVSDPCAKDVYFGRIPFVFSEASVRTLWQFTFSLK
jgi:hypothetical protein